MGFGNFAISYLGGNAPIVFVLITNRVVADSLFGFSVARYNLNFNGVARYYRESDGSYTNIPGEWMLSGSAADYEVRWTLNSGTSPTILTGPAVGAWGTLSSGAEVQLSSTSGTISCNLTCEIRLASSGEVLGSADITLNVDGQA